MSKSVPRLKGLYKTIGRTCVYEVDRWGRTDNKSLRSCKVNIADVEFRKKIMVFCTDNGLKSC